MNEIDIKHGLTDSNERQYIPQNQDPTVPDVPSLLQPYFRQLRVMLLPAYMCIAAW